MAEQIVRLTDGAVGVAVLLAAAALLACSQAAGIRLVPERMGLLRWAAWPLVAAGAGIVVLRLVVLA